MGIRLQYLTLTFGNEYLTPAKYAVGELSMDLGQFIDPFDVLQSHLMTGQAHLQENAIVYWEQEITGHGEM